MKTDQTGANASRLIIFVCLILTLVTLAAYWRVLGHDFVDYDDDVYVTDNRWVKSGLNFASVKWALTRSHGANWHPLTWMSHMSDVSLYGMNPRGHHLSNLILHILGTLALFLLIRRLTGSVWRSAFVAALFAVHPLHVESVAWVSERKDVLSGLFWVLALHAYISYARRPCVGRYMLALGVFTLGLMAKPMLVTLPIVLLLIDYWPLRRLHAVGSKPEGRSSAALRLVLEKVPFFLLTGASCVITFIVQQQGGAVQGTEVTPLGVRLANAAVSYVAYLAKMVWPTKLACLYPHPVASIPTWQVIGYALFLVIVSYLVIRAARARPYLAVGWFWYVIALVPVIGLVQVGAQAMADRYTYIPLTGIFIAMTWGVTEVAVSRYARLLQVTAALIVLVLAARTWHQTGYWRNSIALFSHAIGVTEDNYVAHSGLGLSLNKQGKYHEAVKHLRESVRIAPTGRAYHGLGVVYAQLDRLHDAVEAYEQSLQLQPNDPKTHSNYGFALIALGKLDAAAEHFKEGVSLDPDAVASRCGLAIVYTQRNRLDDAVREYEAAIRIDPKSIQVYAELADILDRQGKKSQAVERLKAALEIRPNPRMHYRLANMLAHNGALDEAMEHYRRTITLDPRHARAHYDLAVALSAKGKFDEAIGHYSEAVKIDPEYAKAHMSFAVALYFKGDYAQSWKELRLARKYGAQIDPEFVKALSAKMPEAGR